MGQKRRSRRFWDDDEKRRIVAQTRVPGVSVSQVARRYDVNANMVFKWLRDPRFNALEGAAASFLPVEVISGTVPPVMDVQSRAGGSRSRLPEVIGSTSAVPTIPKRLRV